jgi:LPS O-antigen subunit length determinant protein (WzzB/FepE family)
MRVEVMARQQALESYAAVEPRTFPEQRRPEYDDEISLFDLWLVLRKRWLSMFLIFAAIAAVGLLYAVLMPESYRYSAAMEIAQVPRGTDVVPIESAETVSTRLTQVSLPAAEKAVRQQSDDATLDLDAEVTVSGTVVTLTGEGLGTKEGAYSAYLAGAMEQLVEVHTEQVAAIRQSIASSLEAVRDQLASFQGASAQPGAWEAAAGLRLRAAELEAQLAALQPSRILSEPTRSEESVGPGSTTIVALALVLGTMMAVFGAFIIEFVSRANAYAREQASAQNLRE